MQNESKTTLLPCPFCGADAGFLNYAKNNEVLGYGITCDVCPATIDHNFKTEDEAAEAWNERI